MIRVFDLGEKALYFSPEFVNTLLECPACGFHSPIQEIPVPIFLSLGEFAFLPHGDSCFGLQHLDDPIDDIRVIVPFVS